MPEQAVALAQSLFAQGNKVVLKVLSRDITHKSDVGGVVLNLATADEVRTAATDILARARKLRPDAKLAGVLVQPMVLRSKARELIIGIADDPTFGPVIVFGRGGTAVEIINDKALALPPLDLALARELIARTRVSRLLAAYRDVPAVKEDAVALTLVKLAQLAADLPEVTGLDINPLLADATGVLAVDARVAVASARPQVRRTRQCALCREALSGGVGAPPRAEGRLAHSDAADPPRGRAADPRLREARHHGRSAAALPGADEAFLARVHRAADPARLCPRHGLRRLRRGERRARRRRAAAFRLDLRDRRIRHPAALRPQGQGARLGADAAADRICASPKD